jgi:peptidoglycan-associated lipoprotein
MLTENRMKKILITACLLAGTALLTGCPKKATTIQPPAAGAQVGGGASTSPGAGGASTSGSALANEGTSGMRGAGGAGVTRGTIYFDFDKSEIKPEYTDIVSSNARNLVSHPGLKMKLEGNTDERGTREYNIGLGERRAQAVRRALMLQGVPDSQLSTVSFGAERPAVEGDDEAAWAKNRRVELVYLP